MNDDGEPFLTRARDCLIGARVAFANERYDNAANRAYYAAFNAALIALDRVGYPRQRWSHDQIQSVFSGDLIRRRKLYPSDLRDTLQELATMRVRADYGEYSLSKRHAQTAIRAAERFTRLVLRLEFP